MRLNVLLLKKYNVFLHLFKNRFKETIQHTCTGKKITFLEKPLSFQRQLNFSNRYILLLKKYMYVFLGLAVQNLR